MGILEKLLMIQGELKAPKGQYNKFGGYKYRSCEDILEAVKPLLIKYNATLTVTDEIILIGDRYYIKATARLFDAEGNTENNFITNTAYARESENKKGQDDSQITGTASSYARKYALNGLFLIDDTKDADTDEYHNQTNQTGRQTPNGNKKENVTQPKATKKAEKAEKAAPITAAQIDEIAGLSKDPNTILKYYKVGSLSELTAAQGDEIITALKGVQR